MRLKLMRLITGGPAAAPAHARLFHGAVPRKERGPGPRAPAGAKLRYRGKLCRRLNAPAVGGYLRCLLTSLVISNIDTCGLPLNTTFSLSSALIYVRRFFLSCRAIFLDIAPDLLGDFGTRHCVHAITAPRAALGIMGFMNAAFGLRFGGRLLLRCGFLRGFFFAIFISPLNFAWGSGSLYAFASFTSSTSGRHQCSGADRCQSRSACQRL